MKIHQNIVSMWSKCVKRWAKILQNTSKYRQNTWTYTKIHQHIIKTRQISSKCVVFYNTFGAGTWPKPPEGHPDIYIYIYIYICWTCIYLQHVYRLNMYISLKMCKKSPSFLTYLCIAHVHDRLAYMMTEYGWREYQKTILRLVLSPCAPILLFEDRSYRTSKTLHKMYLVL